MKHETHFLKTLKLKTKKNLRLKKHKTKEKELKLYIFCLNFTLNKHSFIIKHTFLFLNTIIRMYYLSDYLTALSYIHLTYSTSFFLIT